MLDNDEFSCATTRRSRHDKSDPLIPRVHSPRPYEERQLKRHVRLPGNINVDRLGSSVVIISFVGTVRRGNQILIEHCSRASAFFLKNCCRLVRGRCAFVIDDYRNADPSSIEKKYGSPPEPRDDSVILPL